MKRPQYSIAHIVALEAYSQALTRSKLQKGNHIIGNPLGVTQVSTGQLESYSPEDITITDSTILLSLSERALKICVRIISELKFNNALWYFDHTKNSRDRTAMKELREKKILFQTEDTRIHFVNPDLIRKGNKLLVAANTAAVTSTGRVCKTMIRSLNRKNIDLIQFDNS